MSILTLIEKKKRNEKINEQEFDWFVKNILNNSIQDYQISAFLMSIWFAKLDFDETFYLTKAIVENGKTFSYPSNLKNIVDKHSTGGVGDKVTLILVPLLASLGVKVAKISGRGLGYTGGTIDKMDAINCKSDLNDAKALKILEENGFFVIQQTKDIVPADKILYALRDTSGTVDDISLITASIMSKKIATNADLIYLDTKVGDGAFFSSLSEAHKFGELCIAIGKKFNKKVVIHYTDMDKPLGRGLGNLIEVKEAIDFLNNKIVCSALKELIYEFAKDILIDLNYASNKDEAYKLIDNAIYSKRAYEKFKKWIVLQESNYPIDDLLMHDYKTEYKHEIKADKQGYVNIKSNKELGLSLIEIKAGRKQKTDELDFKAGIYLNKYNGEHVNNGDTIVTIHSSTPITSYAIDKIKNNIEITPTKKELNKTILGVSK